MPLLNLIHQTDTCSVKDYQIRMIFDLTSPTFLLHCSTSKPHTARWMSAAYCVHAPESLLVSAQEGTLYVLEWRSKRSFALQLSAGFHVLLFPLCLAHISRTNSTPLAIPGVLKSRPHSQGKAPQAHGESCRQTYCRSQCTTQAQAKSTGPIHPAFLFHYTRLCFSQW